jgi:mRNA interferase MazF
MRMIRGGWSRRATSLSTSSPRPRRGEVWLVDFDPTKGAEIQKRRPAVVISSDAVGKLPLKLVAPITNWSNAFEGNLWHVRLDPTAQNGLTKTSAADALQIRSVSLDRFTAQLGRISHQELEDIVQALAAVVELA